jgi:galactokinase
MNSAEAIERCFWDVFQSRPAVVGKAPGRFNLIGEHTDYNLGWVMPGAIDKYIFFALGPAKSAVEIYAANLRETAHFSIEGNGSGNGNSWQHYIRAIISALREAGFEVPGFRAVVGGNIPIGAGLSSSAALCCGLISSLSYWQGWDLPQRQIAALAQSAEHLVGLNCGLMDQYAVLFGKAGCLLHLDCRSLEFQYLQMDWSQEFFLLLHSGVKHALAADDAYNQRRASCERVVAALQDKWKTVSSLRDVSMHMLVDRARGLQPTDIQRASFVLAENYRVEQAARAIQDKEAARLGNLLWEGHQGLRDDYQVTCPETDLLVDLAMAQSGVWGARQVGGGFGGCVLVLGNIGMKEAIIAAISEKYIQKTRIHPIVYEFSISNGTEIDIITP